MEFKIAVALQRLYPGIFWSASFVDRGIEIGVYALLGKM